MAVTWILILVNLLLSNACIPQKNSPTSSYSPRILSTLYGYDNCIGGVNNFDTEEEYMEDLKRRNCTVVMGPDGKEITNAAPARNMRLACKNQDLEWMDGMPMVFNFPFKDTPDKEAFEVKLSD